MTTQAPSGEPDKVSAGTSWLWRRDDLTDYPSATWTLRYLFANTAAQFTFDAVADGGGFLIARSVAQTAGIVAGSYAWSANVTSDAGANLYEVGRGALVVRPSLASAADPRSHARKVLDAIEAAIEGRASRTDLQYEVSVGGSLRRLWSIPHEQLVQLRNQYRAEVRSEEERDRVAQGRGGRRRILSRFVRPVGGKPWPPYWPPFR